MTPFAIVLLGFFLGMRHATDPDHVVAVATVVARRRDRSGAAAIGALWGVGHTLTLLVVGAGIILLGWAIPPRLGLALELAVGVMLIVLGVMNLSGGHDHSRLHVHAHAPGDYVRPLVVGVVHGLAGSAAVALLVLTTIKDPLRSVLYLLVFGVGTIAGMMLITAALGWPFVKLGGRFATLHRGVRVASGLVSLAFGAVLAYRIGVGDGLFGAMVGGPP